MTGERPVRRAARWLAASVVAATALLTAPAAPAAAMTPLVFDPYLLNQLNRLFVPGQAPVGIDGKGVGVALIDTGVVPVRGLPAAQIVNGPDLSVESQSPALRYHDTNGHGTAMAGIIVGDDPTTGYRGVAPKAKLTSIKVAAADGSVDVTQVMAAVDWVVEHRNDDPANPIRIINLAYGTDSTQSYLSDPLTKAVENAWAKGLTVVVAAGNSGATSGTLANPAIDPFVLAVGSLSTGLQSSTFNSQCDLTSPGSFRNPDISVPGEQVVSLRNPGSYLDQAYPGARYQDVFFRGSGTSQASALVSGGLALLLQKRPTLTNNQIKGIVKSSGYLALNSPGTLELDLSRAMTSPAMEYPQYATRSSGYGTLQGARGSSPLVDNGVALSGEQDLFGPFRTSLWATMSQLETSWSGGAWMGHTMAGSGWTGTSWASRTWGAATWAGTSWSGQPWVSSDWSGRYWSGRYWSTGSWSGRYWSGRYWSTTNWATGQWG